MDYIYGKLNFEAEMISYKGGTTSTAIVTVDTTTNIITVDVLDIEIVDGGIW